MDGRRSCESTCVEVPALLGQSATRRDKKGSPRFRSRPSGIIAVLAEAGVAAVLDIGAGGVGGGAGVDHGAGECGHGMCEGVFGVVRDLVSLGEAQVVQTGYAGSIPVATPAS